MDSLRFEKMQLKKLAAEIGCRPVEIQTLLNDLDEHYRFWEELKVNKDTGEFKRYKDGTIKKRTISPSDERLSRLQKNLTNRILVKIPLPSNIHGGVKGKSNVTNAVSHKGKKYTFATDLQEFYPNISSRQIVDAFLKLGYTDHYAHWIAKLTTWNHEVPQGAPSSGHIANIVFLQTDLKLITLCNLHHITYTRYVDDLTFSSSENFEEHIPKILNIIINDGFKISRRKTEFAPLQNITGIDVFNNKIDAPEKILKKVLEENQSQDPAKPYTNYYRYIQNVNARKRQK
ncbi:MAG: RNA-directed DNA polymerase [Bacteroidetes bacterium]|nr:RNA-directed DNA polymerase [Bacteroidota bacterium]